jgi:hypothetical protein
MIKSVVVSLVALSVVFVPVAAEARDRDGYRGGNHSEQREHKRSRISTGEAIALGLGAFILGAAVSSKRTAEPVEDDRRIDREVYDREYNYHYRRSTEPTCYNEYQPLYNRRGHIVEYKAIATCY